MLPVLHEHGIAPDRRASRAQLGLDAATSIEAKLDRLEAIVRQSGDVAHATLPLLAELLGLPSGKRHPPLDLTPQRRKERTIDALCRHVIGLSRQQALLVLFEDVHWVDPTTLELIDHLVELSLGERLLLVVTYRPEFTPLWGGLPNVTGHTLGRLGRHDSGALIDRVAGGKPMPAALREEIIRRTDGVPLFVEELTKAVLESSLLTEQADR